MKKERKNKLKYTVKRQVKQIVLLLACIIPAFIASCTDREGTHEPEGEKDEKVVLHLKLPADTRSQTYALTSADEQPIGSVRILAFVDNGTDYLYSYSRVGTLFSQSGSDIEFRVTLTAYGSRQKLVILANCSDEVEAAGITTSDNIVSAMNKIKITQYTEWPAGTVNDGGKRRTIPMCAMTDALSVDESFTAIGSVSKPLFLIRMLARIDISLQPTITNFKLVSASLFNRKNKGYVAYNSPDYWDDTEKKALKAYVPQVDPGFVTTKLPSVDRYYPAAYPDGNSLGEFVQTIYTFETKGVSEKSEATAVVIGGYFDYPANSSKLSYYRVDIPRYNGDTPVPGTMGDMLRNHLYNVVIQEFTVPGADTEEKAFDGSLTVEARIVPWNLAELDDISFVGVYGFKVDPATIIADKIGATGKTVSVRTDYYKGWQAVLVPETANSWIRFAAGTVFEGKPGITTGLNFDLLPNATGIPRHAFLKVKAGGLTKYVDIFQAENLSGNIFDWIQSVQDENDKIETNGPYRLGVSRGSYPLYKNVRAGIPLMISTDCPKGWIATSSDESWLTITQNGTVSAPDSKVLLFSVAENSTRTDRTAYIRIKAGNMEKIIIVTQNTTLELTGNNSIILPWEDTSHEPSTGFGGPYALKVERDYCKYDGGTKQRTIRITATGGGNWTATTATDSWITLITTSGAADGSDTNLTFSLPDYLSGADRSGIITIKSGNMKKEIRVVQYAGPAITATGLAESYIQDSSVKTFTLTAKASWYANIISDTYGILQQLRTSSGIVTAGSDFQFTLKSAVNSDRQTATIGFYSYDGEFDRTDITINVGTN